MSFAGLLKLCFFASKNMAKGKLTDDEIKLILSLDANQAQQSIHQLTKENKSLEQSNKLLRKEMLNLELQGKKNSQEYKNAEKALKDNNRQLDVNRAKIREHEKTLGLENMTMKQLQKRAKDLQNQLDNTVRSLHPEAWNRLNSELEETRNQMNSLRGRTQEVDSVLESLVGKGTLAIFLGNMLTEASKGVMTLINKAKEFISEGVEMARKAEGVERAFNKLNDPDLLSNLRGAVRGTVDDLTLMQTAVKANNFKIPLDNLATYLKFAQQRAQETGESVDYLVNSIITGIGRKSPLILDNLGISAAELSEEMKKTGDFAQAAGAIIEKELLKQGNLMDTGAEKAAARAAELKNYQLQIGKIMAGIYETISRISTGAIVGLINGFVKYRNVILSLATGVAAYVTITKGKIAVQILVDFWNKKVMASTLALTLKEKLHAAAVAASTVATYAKGLAHDVLAKKISLAYAAQEALRFAFMKTPWGLIISAIVAIGVACYNAAKKTSELTAEQKMLNEINQKTAEKFADQKNKIEMLVKAIENENNSNELRRQKINELREIMPSYNGMLDQEGKLINHNSESIKEYLLWLQKKIELESTEDIRRELSKKKNLAQMDYDEASAVIEKAKEDPKSKGRYLAGNYTGEERAAFNKQTKAKKEILEASEAISQLDKLTEKRMKEIDAISSQTKETLSLIAAKEKEIELTKQEVKNAQTENELIVANRKLKKLNEEMEGLQKLGVEKKEEPKSRETTEKSALDTRLQALENTYKERRLIIDLNEAKEWQSEQEHQSMLLAAEESYLNGRIDLLSLFHTSYKKLDTDANSQLLESKLKLAENSRKQDEQLIKGIQEVEKKELDIIQTAFENERVELKRAYESKRITKEAYDARMLRLEHGAAFARQEVIKSSGKAIETLELVNEDVRVKALEKSGKERVEAERKTLESLSALTKNYYENDRSLREQYGKISIEEEKKRELARIDAMRNHVVTNADGSQAADPLISAEATEIAKEAIVKKYEEMKFQVRQDYGLVRMDELYQSELEALKAKYEQEYLTEEEFERAKLTLKLKYAKEYAQKAGEFAQAGANAVKAVEEAETAGLEAEYTKRQSALTEQYNQGILSEEEYNEQKKQLDYEQRVKELEIQKKYADVNFAMQIAQIVSTTAQGIMSAWASAQTYPFPYSTIVGAAMTALLGATSTAQIAKAKAERDRVKAMTIESPGGGSTSAKTGSIKLKEGFSEGGYNDDEQDKNLTPGGYSGAGGKYEVAGYLPVHHGEYVVDTESLKYPDVVEKVRAIEQVRRRHSQKNPLPEGFAEGGSNAPSSPGTFALDKGTGRQIALLLEKLVNGDVVVQTNYGITELEAAQLRKQKSESKFTKA